MVSTKRALQSNQCPTCSACHDNIASVVLHGSEDRLHTDSSHEAGACLDQQASRAADRAGGSRLHTRHSLLAAHGSSKHCGRARSEPAWGAVTVAG